MSDRSVDEHFVTDEGVIHSTLTTDGLVSVTSHCLAHFRWEPIGAVHPWGRRKEWVEAYVKPTSEEITCLLCLARMS